MTEKLYAFGMQTDEKIADIVLRRIRNDKDL
jgi:hypothetical protein